MSSRLRVLQHSLRAYCTPSGYLFSLASPCIHSNIIIIAQAGFVILFLIIKYPYTILLFRHAYCTDPEISDVLNSLLCPSRQRGTIINQRIFFKTLHPMRYGTMISRIDHVSIATRDYDKALHFFRDILGAVPGTFAEDETTKFFWQILSLGDLSRIELIRKAGKGGLLENFLEDKIGGVHHITLETPDILKTMKVLDENNIPYFGYSEFPGGIWKEIFIHPRDAFGVLLQIAEFSPDDWISDSVKFPPGKKWSVEKSGDGLKLSLAHPGGGKVYVELTGEEAKNFLRDVEKAL